MRKAIEFYPIGKQITQITTMSNDKFLSDQCLFKRGKNVLLSNKTVLITLLIAIITAQYSCKKLIEVDTPITSLNAGNVFTNDASAAAVLTAVYADISKKNIDVSGITSAFFWVGLSADELKLYDINRLPYLAYYRNDLTSLADVKQFWDDSYTIIAKVNLALDGLGNATTLTPAIKNQLIGEARFIRAFYYFYLVNFFGDVPLVLSTDYKINASLPRTDTSKIYSQIVEDLTTAQDLLFKDYINADGLTPYPLGSEERTRPNYWVATALLARVYLFSKNYIKAEAEATKLINETSLYNLTSLNDVFLKNSRESIWQLQPVGTQLNTGEGYTFILPATGPQPGGLGPGGGGGYPVYLSNELLHAFEADDQRKTLWMDSVKPESVAYYYSYKYKIGRLNVTNPSTEYIMVFRLAEQYLIRAEARLYETDIEGTQQDINAIRSRSGLSPILATEKDILLNTIIHERQVELFTEWGHRWLDLKRLGKVDEVMSAVAANKGGNWKSFQALYPIPLNEIQKNSSLSQNPGY